MIEQEWDNSVLTLRHSKVDIAKGILRGFFWGGGWGWHKKENKVIP